MNNANEFYASILNNVREDAKAEERERIIKLLGDECCQSGDCRCSVSIDWLISLIKGEKK